jgi:hypothetical protein
MAQHVGRRRRALVLEIDQGAVVGDAAHGMAHHLQCAGAVGAARGNRREFARVLAGGEKDHAIRIGSDPADHLHQAALRRGAHGAGGIVEPLGLDAEGRRVFLGPAIGEGRVAVLVGGIGVAAPAERVSRRGGGVEALVEAGLAQALVATVHGCR